MEPNGAKLMQCPTTKEVYRLSLMRVRNEMEVHTLDRFSPVLSWELLLPLHDLECGFRFTHMGYTFPCHGSVSRYFSPWQPTPSKRSFGTFRRGTKRSYEVPWASSSNASGFLTMASGQDRVGNPRKERGARSRSPENSRVETTGSQAPTARDFPMVGGNVDYLPEHCTGRLAS
ncbi:hypothetical protein EK21DRAFT_89374 [Setomelanomma holmii]|uniref:Uncharacterized protein n=1 Tax=Setomelanomma holmii TaxID=210430 RepID=A0A9P4LK46_9PLEO|nr:hypothetical protein EK21DRAFT_89374 [Setomelanomma holmii]